MKAPELPAPLAARYHPVRLLGAGGMGTVYLCEDQVLVRPVAVKVLNQPPGDEWARRFLREAEGLARVRHPGVVTLFEHGVVEGRPYLVMEHVAGFALDRAPGDLDPVGPLLEVAEALEAVHAAGLVHRDVKPGNLILGTDGRTRLVDFGVLFDPGVTPLTQEGAVVGTVPYVAPECLGGGPWSPAADWYAWGITLFALCEGRLPFAPGAVFGWLAGRERPPIEMAGPAATPGVRAAVDACLQRDPGARPTSAEALRRLLAGAPAGAEVVRSRALAPAPRREPAPAPRGGVALVAASLLAALGLAASWSIPGEQAPVTPPGQAPGPRRPPSSAPRDGSELVEVPGGEFPIGAASRAPPSGRRFLPPFRIGRYEVTVGQYQRFLDESGRRSPLLWTEQVRRPDLPVVLVDFDDARAYCRWAGGDLPTEDQWEKAAAGPGGRRYPWGDEEPDPTRARYGVDELGVGLGWQAELRPPGSSPAGRGPFGAADQAGNVAEWCRPDRPGVRPSVRGGSWSRPASHLRTKAWVRRDARHVDHDVGFRLCFPPEQAAGPG